MDHAQMSAHAEHATAPSPRGVYPHAHRLDLGGEATTRSRVRRWLHQLGSKAETRQALSRITDNAVLDDVVTLLLAAPEVQRTTEVRPSNAWPWAPPWERYQVGDLLIDGATREVRLFGRLLTLEPIERALLEYLVVHRARVVGRDELLRCVWGGGRFRSRVADAYIGRLRRKLDGANVAIATIRGAGYRIVESPFDSAGVTHDT